MDEYEELDPLIDPDLYYDAEDDDDVPNMALMMEAGFYNKMVPGQINHADLGMTKIFMPRLIDDSKEPVDIVFGTLDSLTAEMARLLDDRVSDVLVQQDIREKVEEFLDSTDAGVKDDIAKFEKQLLPAQLRAFRLLMAAQWFLDTASGVEL